MEVFCILAKIQTSHAFRSVSGMIAAWTFNLVINIRRLLLQTEYLYFPKTIQVLAILNVKLYTTITYTTEQHKRWRLSTNTCPFFPRKARLQLVFFNTVPLLFNIYHFCRYLNLRPAILTIITNIHRPVRLIMQHKIRGLSFHDVDNEMLLWI